MMCAMALRLTPRWATGGEKGERERGGRRRLGPWLGPWGSLRMAAFKPRDNLLKRKMGGHLFTDFYNSLPIIELALLVSRGGVA